MELSTIISIILGAGCLGMVGWNLRSTQPKPDQTAVPADPADKFRQIFNKALEQVPAKQEQPSAIIGPSRDQAFAAAFLVIDYARQINKPDVAKLIADQLPALAGGKE